MWCSQERMWCQGWRAQPRKEREPVSPEYDAFASPRQEEQHVKNVKVQQEEGAEELQEVPPVDVSQYLL